MGLDKQQLLWMIEQGADIQEVAFLTELKELCEKYEIVPVFEYEVNAEVDFGFYGKEGLDDYLQGTPYSIRGRHETFEISITQIIKILEGKEIALPEF